MRSGRTVAKGCVACVLWILLQGSSTMALPILIDAAHSAFFHNTNQTPWMISFNNALYAFLEYSLGGTRGAHFYKSTDGGATWAELDAGGSPASINDAFICWDTANSRAIVCYNTLPTPSALQLTQFNLTTGTWGAAIAAGGPNSSAAEPIWGVFLRPDTSIAVVYDNGVGSAVNTRMTGTVWNGAAWSAPLDLGTNMPFIDSTGGHTTIQPASCVMDTTGLIHIFPVGVGPGITHNYWGYQQWKTDNTLGNFHVFGTGIAFNDSRGTNMVIYGADQSLMLGILSGAQQTVCNLFIGTPLTNPVWTQSTPAALTVAFANSLSGPPTISLAAFKTGNSKAVSVGLVSLNSGASLAAYALNSESPPAGPVAVAMLTQTDVNGFIFVQLVTSVDAGVTWTILPSDVNPNYNYYLGFSPVDPAIDVPPASFNGILIPSLQLVAGVGRGGGIGGGGPDGSGGSGGGGGIMNTEACVGGFPNFVRGVRYTGQAPRKKKSYRDEGVEEWPFTWAKRFVIPAPTVGIPILRHQPFVITDADFVARCYMVDTSRTNQLDFQGLSPFDQIPFRMAISRPDESLIHCDNRATFGQGYSSIATIVESGTARTPIPIIPEMHLIRDTSLYVDLSNDFNNVATPVELAFKGVKLFPKGTHYAPPAGYFTLMDFEYKFLLQSLGPMTAGTNFAAILPLDDDSDFCLLAVGCGPLAGLSIQVFGANGVEPLSNSLVSIGNFCGDSAFPSGLCAPVFYPPGGQIKFNFYVPNPAPTQVTASPGEGNPGYFTFRGMKMLRRK